jgi:hypothetical protein
MAEYGIQNNNVVSREHLKKLRGDFVDGFSKSFSRVRHETFWSRIIDVISSMPKEEMAIVAEALVDLTSLRRKVTNDLASVGGPVDIAIITKGDGFVWTKRKHYFDLAKNMDFVLRKFAQTASPA